MSKVREGLVASRHAFHEDSLTIDWGMTLICSGANCSLAIRLNRTSLNHSDPSQTNDGYVLFCHGLYEASLYNEYRGSFRILRMLSYIETGATDHAIVRLIGVQLSRDAKLL
jgi:hypothetical protein